MESMPITVKMLKIIHRVNTIGELKRIPKEYGVEIDIRGFGEKLLLTHDPVDENKRYDELESYLKNFHHALLIFNVKEAGYEERIIECAKKCHIENYFFLDVEFPYLFRATRKGFRKVAIRYSEAEPIENVLAQKKDGKPLADWVWIDTITTLPLNRGIMKKLSGFKTCLVSPDRWDRLQDIKKYKEFMKKEGIHVDAVMTSLEHAGEWND